MKRVAILGNSGAGKTELAHAVARRTGLPVVHLDPLFWEAGWSLAPRDLAEAGLREAVSGDEWILDGMFLGAVSQRFERADTVIFLDLPRRTCIRRILWRRVRDRKRVRPDLPAGGREGFDLELLRWIWGFPKATRPRVLALLAGLDADVVHLRTPAEIRAYAASI